MEVLLLVPSGKWLKEEEERLEQAVYDLTETVPGQQVTSGINWAAVAQQVRTTGS